ncbi:asparagine synthase-related protein [Cupriavidus sp. 2TAF22]|uniref:asparagine synthase-related protein n=1 Tax=unclassified Cupriavidus TaxID=2640874 RepID=UPI003F93B800
MRRRTVADVPVGMLPSGGVDSSRITGLHAETGTPGLRTHAIGFESVGGEAGDASQYPDLVASHFGTHREKMPIPAPGTMCVPRCFASAQVHRMATSAPVCPCPCLSRSCPPSIFRAAPPCRKTASATQARRPASRTSPIRASPRAAPLPDAGERMHRHREDRSS